MEDAEPHINGDDHENVSASSSGWTCDTMMEAAGWVIRSVSVESNHHENLKRTTALPGISINSSVQQRSKSLSLKYPMLRSKYGKVMVFARVSRNKHAEIAFVRCYGNRYNPKQTEVTANIFHRVGGRDEAFGYPAGDPVRLDVTPCWPTLPIDGALRVTTNDLVDGWLPPRPPNS